MDRFGVYNLVYGFYGCSAQRVEINDVVPKYSPLRRRNAVDSANLSSIECRIYMYNCNILYSLI